MASKSTPAPVILSRDRILAFRRRAGLLDQRRPAGASTLRRAAWAGLQDSAPRAALLSMHARVEGTRPDHWEHRSLVQLWGPRFSDYVVADRDLAVFSLGRLPDSARGRTRAHDTAARLARYLRGRRMPFGEAGRGMGVPGNSLRYAAATGTVLIRWDGARQPVVWTVPAPTLSAPLARAELARRYLHVFGPGSVAGFQRWAGIGAAEARRAFEALAGEIVPALSPIGTGWILAVDEPEFSRRPDPADGVRFLPSGDAYTLLWGADRALLEPDPKRRAALWTTRVWPGALLIRGELAGTWRRSAADVSIEPWGRLSRGQRATVEAEAASLPLPGLDGDIRVVWT
ncbi:MAG: crosslink repair DNA glycosylase YcaQ family protein [Gemmatimonadales bacterium]